MPSCQPKCQPLLDNLNKPLTDAAAFLNSLKLSEVDWMTFKDLTTRELKPKIFEAVRTKIRTLNKRVARKGQEAD